MGEELWRDIEGYVGLYMVSNHGRVKSLNYNHTGEEGILRPVTNDKYGHLVVNLCKNGIQKQMYIHRLVLTAFVGECPEGMECLHINGIASDNRLENLRYGTRKDNIQDSIKHKTHACLRVGGNNNRSKLTKIQVILIKQMISVGILQRRIARSFNVALGTISDIKTGKTWGDISFVPIII